MPRDGNLEVTGFLGLGDYSPQTIVSSGRGAIDTSDKAEGSLHLRKDGNPEVIKPDGTAAKLGYSQHALEMRMGTLADNVANTYTTYAPRDMTVTGISRRFLAAPASASGTVVTGIVAGGNQLLSSSSTDEEAVVDDTLTAYTLTSTLPDLVLVKGDKIVVTMTSDNADMTDGTDTQVFIYADDS